MSYSKLPNYLKTYRKRASLSQDDVAFLLGARTGAKVCRYERFVREPSLRTALAFVVIFQTPEKELFAGLYQNAQKQVTARINILTQKLARSKPSRLTAHKLKILKAIVAERSTES
jgi:transcriptional regulator with XRE-family HTH domain